MAGPQLDDFDRQLIAVLARDARVSNRKIAADLGVTEGTVRGRIRRLQQEKLIAFTALTSLSTQGATKLAFIAIQTDVDRVRAIADEIAKIPKVTGVLVTLGRSNIIAICLFDELEELVAVASDQILAMPGVHHVETSIAVKTFKYNARIVKITGDATARRIGRDRASIERVDHLDHCPEGKNPGSARAPPAGATATRKGSASPSTSLNLLIPE